MANGKSSEQWGSRIGVILAVAGSAVGLGNFLRFPGTAAEHGGGAFMIPYFVSLVVLGIPLGWAEWTMGRYGGVRGVNSAPAIYTMIWRHPAAKYVGALALIIPLVIYMYYVLIEAWCLSYAIGYVTGELAVPEKQVYDDFFTRLTGVEENGALLAPNRTGLLVVIGATFTVNFLLIYRGISKGIEALCNAAMPMMLVLGLIVLARVLTLGTPDPSKPDQSLMSGLAFLWNPKWEAVRDPKTWLAAAGQIFFSLSVGFGIVINYASYLREDDDVALSSLTASSVNEFFEVCMGGLITIPAAVVFLGVAASTEVVGSSFSLGFRALPHVFSLMPGGRIFGLLWFTMLFLAALTSSVSMLQPVIAFLEEGLGLKRHASVAMLGLIAALGLGYVLYFSKGLVALDTFDFWVGSVLIFTLALFQSILYGWVFGIERGHRELHRGAQLQVPWVIQLMLKYVTPLFLLVIFSLFCWEKIPSREARCGYLTAADFRTTSEDAADPAAGRISPALREALSAVGQEVSEDATLQVPNRNTWRIVQGRAVTLIARLDSQEEGFEIYKRTPGYVEAIFNDRVAFSSILFIAVILVFFLTMVHIAGIRWEKMGKFKVLDQRGGGSAC